MNGVSDKPKFNEVEVPKDDDSLPVFTVVEGESMLINLKAEANPGPVDYTWSRKESDKWISIPSLADALPQSRIIDKVRKE